MNPRLRERFDKAVKLKRSGQLNLAKQILEQLATLDSKSPAIFSVLGHVCWKLGLLHQGAAAFRKATKLAPKLEAASLGLFLCLEKMGKQDQALEEVKRFMSISDSQNYREIIDEMYQNCKKVDKPLVKAVPAKTRLVKKHRK